MPTKSRPIVSRSGLAEHKVVRAEELAEGSSTHTVHRACQANISSKCGACICRTSHVAHYSASLLSTKRNCGAWLQIHQNRTRNVAAAGRFVEVDIDTFLAR